jgi:hypothetical protein
MQACCASHGKQEARQHPSNQVRGSVMVFELDLQGDATQAQRTSATFAEVSVASRAATTFGMLNARRLAALFRAPRRPPRPSAAETHLRCGCHWWLICEHRLGRTATAAQPSSYTPSGRSPSLPTMDARCRGLEIYQPTLQTTYPSAAVSLAEGQRLPQVLLYQRQPLTIGKALSLAPRALLHQTLAIPVSESPVISQVLTLFLAIEI